VRYLEQEIELLDLVDQVSVFAGGCQSHCETGPSMVVYPGGIFYQYIDRARLQRIAREHLAGGSPVADYLWSDPAQSYRRKDPRPGATPGSQPTYGRRPDPGGAKPQKKAKKSYDVDDFKW
jgi:(2Fe-2S) ferredoxin